MLILYTTEKQFTSIYGVIPTPLQQISCNNIVRGDCLHE